MEFIYVESSLDINRSVDFTPASLNLTKNVLISLIYGFQQLSFGFDTVKSLAVKLSEYKKRLNQDIQIYIDSGGYSVIKGDVKFDDTQKLIDSYNRFLQYENHLCDYIFTLDIPLWGNEQANTTRDNLYRFNYESLRQTIDVLGNQPHLRDKLYFVWQFANPTQYDVWSQIYSQLNINQHVKNMAIGGLVGIRERSRQLDFSPFTTMAFKCFYDYLNGPFTSENFRLHILGTYHKVDRLQLILLEKLFSHYCHKKGFPEPTVTYDTINYYLTAMYQLKNLQPYGFHNKQLTRYTNILDVEDFVIRQIYYTQVLYDAYQKGKATFEQLDPSLRQDNPDFLVPLNVFSNLSLDRYLSSFIERYSLFSRIVNTCHSNTYIKQVRAACYDIGPDADNIFNRTDLMTIQNNLDDLYFLWDWLINGFNNAPWLEEKIKQTIYRIGFERWE